MLIAGAGGGNAASPLWLTDAEHQAPVKVLKWRWEGLTGQVARWKPRWATVWRGRLYLSRQKDDGIAIDYRWEHECDPVGVLISL